VIFVASEVSIKPKEQSTTPTIDSNVRFYEFELAQCQYLIKDTSIWEDNLWEIKDRNKIYIVIEETEPGLYPGFYRYSF
jgi:hypothetical protein